MIANKVELVFRRSQQEWYITSSTEWFLPGLKSTIFLREFLMTTFGVGTSTN